MTTDKEYRAQNNERKNRVLSLLQATEKFYRDSKDITRADALKSLQESVNAGEFSIVMVGEFSAGKSSLLNAMMRGNFLPSFSGETTATINYLRHTDSAPKGEKGIVYYTDGTQDQIPSLDKKTVEQYVSTRGKDVVNHVDHLDLYLQSEYLRDNVMLVDSPGLNGVAKGHAEVTERQIERSHASIFVFSADHPGTKTEFETLARLKQKVNTIFIVINKIDIIKRSEGETPELIIKTLKKNYQEQFPNETTIPEIYPVSAIQALVARCNDGSVEYEHRNSFSAEEKQQLEQQSNLAKFESRLMEFLTNSEKNLQLFQGPVMKVLSFCAEDTQHWKEEINVLQGKTDAEDIKLQIEEAEKAIEELNTQINGKKSEIQTKVKEKMGDISEGITAELAKKGARMVADTQSASSVQELLNIGNGFKEDFNRFAQHTLTDAEATLREEMQSLVGMFVRDSFAELKMNTGSLTQISVDREFTKPETIQSGIDEANAEIEELRKKVEQAQATVKCTQENVRKARHAERNLQQLKDKLAEQEAKKESYENMVMPTIEREQYQDYEKHWRGGLFGFFGTILGGRKTEVVTKYRDNARDKEEYNKAVATQQKRIQESDRKIAEITQAIKATASVDTEQAEYNAEYAQQQLTSTQETLARKEEEAKKRLQEKQAENIRKLQRELTYYVEDTSSDLRKQINAKFAEMRAAYTDMICTLVITELTAAIDKEKERLENLIGKLNTSEANKKQQIAELQQKIAAVAQFSEQACDLKEELEGIDTAQIQEERL